MLSCSALLNPPFLSTPSKKLISLILSAFFLTVSTAAYAEAYDIRVEEGYTNPPHLIGSDAGSVTPGAANPLDELADQPHNLADLAPRHILWFGSEFWIAGIGTLLYKDDDRDGYFSGFSLAIDADTQYSHAEVYAAIDLQHPQGNRERLHTTGTFNLYGNSLSDEYRIDIELVQNYPIEHYDLFVNLVDAHDNRVLDTVDASEFSNLLGLPLESEDRDHPFQTNHPETAAPTTPTINTDIRVTEYSGALNNWALLALMFSIFWRCQCVNRRG